ncbi:hypothetical protein OX284_002005 [Flavobacterium sp. SUN046]|jgi:hypothetical protein|uniref:hypothetical protein n=1 Tax=Flavobacterium sp. SUN046 TaxID=3002440 RepID=UPI002DBAEE4C|nr:hypothetical protein [Flavobacterium sp. SUN046]MEC4048188.1 hypothetical protein [Flavobacterium sp. SUN046]
MKSLKLTIPRKITKQRMIEILFSIGVFLLIIIPKGGIKVAQVPITWGYLYLGLMFLIIGRYVFIKNQKHSIPLKLLICYLASFLFFIFFIFHLFFLGYDGRKGDLIAYLVNFGFLPFLFLIILPPYFSQLSQDFINRRICNAIFITSLYGIILFVIKNIFKTDIEIPYLTINAADIGDVADKYNQRGNIMKLISTYNNGNIFGVCTLMLFPLFYYNTQKKYKIAIVILALVLTLSRTVWLGLLFFFLIVYRNKIYNLLKSLILVLIFISILSFFFFSSKFQYGSLGGFVLDSRLGGRISQVRQSLEFSFFGLKPFSNVAEIVYLSIFKQLGIIGLLIYLIAFLTPIFLFFNTKNNNFQYILGVIIYVFVSMSDGCTLFIPTLAFFSFVVAMSFIKNNVNEN